MPIFQTTAVSAAQTGTTSAAKGTLGKDDFLKLLTNQLKYQDPMNPLKGSEFASQLAQFSQVEQLNNISTTLTDSINANYVLTQAINNGLSAGFVGKEVRVSNDSIKLSEAGAAARDTKLGYNLASAATTVKVTIKDENGNVVRSMSVSGTDTGDNTFTWDGRNNAGGDVPAGKYTFSVDAVDTKNATVSASTFTFGKVSSVRFTSDGTKFVINGQEISLGSILEILGG